MCEKNINLVVKIGCILLKNIIYYTLAEIWQTKFNINGGLNL